MSYLVTWLRAQLDEDEQREVLAAAVMRLRPSTAQFGNRLLAEVAAKRQILDMAEQAANDAATKPGYDAVARLRTNLAKVTAPELERVVRLLALPYAGRPGYDETWRP